MFESSLWFAYLAWLPVVVESMVPVELQSFLCRLEHEPPAITVRIVDGFGLLFVWFTVDACLLV